jgi:hypothetical protein
LALGDLARRSPAVVLSVSWRGQPPGIWFNDHIEEEDGETVFRHACKLGLEGIVSKRKDSPYRSGLTQLAQDEEPGLRGGKKRGGGGLGT